MRANDISVVVQGTIDKVQTYNCLKSINKYLPGSEIIVSTWKGQDVSAIKGLYSIIIFNDDPGAELFDLKENKLNNLNRIILSSYSGIKQASRKFVLRIRSDLFLKNDNILNLKDPYKYRKNDYRLFRNRIFSYEIFSIKKDVRNAHIQNMLFHISDWCYFGLKDDLYELFDLPLVLEPQFSQYFTFNNKDRSDVHKSRLWRMSPEQYIVSKNAQKVNSSIEFKNYLDVNNCNTKISEAFIINNFVVFSPSKWGIFTQKDIYRNINLGGMLPSYYYSRYEQNKDYVQYCLSNCSFFDDLLYSKCYSISAFHSLIKHVEKFNRCSFFKKKKHIIPILYYLIISCFCLFCLILKKIIYSLHLK